MPSSRTEHLALPDVNVLIALVYPGHVHHRAALAWFGEVGEYATTPITEAGLLRLMLNPKVVGQAVASTDALATLASVRRDPRARHIEDRVSFSEPYIDLVGLAGFRQVTDLHLVNLAAANDAVLVTFDPALGRSLVAGDQHLVQLLA